MCMNILTSNYHGAGGGTTEFPTRRENHRLICAPRPRTSRLPRAPKRSVRKSSSFHRQGHRVAPACRTARRPAGSLLDHEAVEEVLAAAEALHLDRHGYMNAAGPSIVEET